MAAKPIPRKRQDGTVAWRQPFRLKPGGSVTYETFDTRDDALAFGRLVDKIGGEAAREVRTASTSAAADIPTLDTWLERHLDQLAASRTSGTIGDYRRMAARTWGPKLGPLPIDAITRDSVIAWVAEQRKAETEKSRRARSKAIAAQRVDKDVRVPEPVHYSPKSIANAHGLLSAVLEAAVDAELIPRNVAKGVPLPSDAERGEMVILTENEFTELYDAMPAHWRPLVATLYSTGMRWGEATALTPGDLDLDSQIPTVRVTRAWKKGDRGVYLGSPKTRRGRRTISLPRQMVEPLRSLCAGKPADDLLFAAMQGGRVSAQHFHNRVWRPAIAKSGIGKQPRVHDLRHTHASHMIAAGMNLLQLQHRLGHESLKVTGDTYGHLMPDALASGAALASASLAGAMPEISTNDAGRLIED